MSAIEVSGLSRPKPQIVSHQRPVYKPDQSSDKKTQMTAKSPEQTFKWPLHAAMQRTTWCVCGCRSPWADEVQYTGLNEAATEENDNGILCWIGRVRQRNVDLYYG